MNEKRKSAWWKTGCLVVLALPLVAMVASGLVHRCENRENQRRAVAAHQAALEQQQHTRERLEKECADLVAAVERGPSSPSGPTSTIEDRLVQRRLTLEDYRIKVSDLPCAETSVSRRQTLWKAFVESAAKSLSAESLATLDEELLGAIRARALTEEQIDALEMSVEDLAKARLKNQDSSSLEAALVACARVTTLGAPKSGPACLALKRKHELMERRQQAQEKREAAIEAAKERANEQCVNRCDRSFPDMGPRWDTCNNRCLGLDEPLF